MTTVLIGDVGGTNARFALASPDVAGYRDEQILLCEDFDTPELAVQSYLDSLDSEPPEAACIAAAGPVVDGGVDFTNNDWHLKEKELSAVLGGVQARVLNDFEAVAFSLPELADTDLAAIGQHKAPDLGTDKFTVGVIGPGTGLGAAGLISQAGCRLPIKTEMGRVGFAPETALQKAVWEVMRNRFGRVSDERMVSGSGLENIYTALSEIHGETIHTLTAAEVFDQAPGNHLATETINLFFEMLGQVAGNFALSVGAFDGVFIGGGIAQRYETMLLESSFRVSFENKGRHRYLMERIPVSLIRHQQPGLLGAAVVAASLGSS